MSSGRHYEIKKIFNTCTLCYKLNSDGQQFHHQQNEISLLTSKHKRNHDMHGVGNPGLDSGHAQKCGGFKPVNGIQTLSL